MSSKLPPMSDFSLIEGDIDYRIMGFIYGLFKNKKRLKSLMTNNIHYEVARHLKTSKVRKIILSRNYCVLMIAGKNGRYIPYLVGINSDGKLFINKLPLERSQVRALCRREPIKKYGMISIIKEKSLLSALHFINLENAEEKKFPIADFFNYRLQGDLYAHQHASYNSAIRMYKCYLFFDFERKIANLFREIVNNRISKLLAEYNISTYIEENEVYVPIPKYISRLMARKIMKKIMDIIVNELYLADMKIGKVQETYDVTHIYFAGIEKQIALSISLEMKTGRVCNYIVISSFVFPEHIKKLFSKEYQVLESALKKQRTTTEIGRHRLEFFAYPTNLTVSVKLDLFEDSAPREIIVPVTYTHSFGVASVTPQGELRFTKGLGYLVFDEIKISHPEHGTIKYEVEAPTLLTFYTSPLDDEFVARCNHYAFKKLLGGNSNVR